MPSPLLLRKIAKVPTGYPTTGLVAYWDLINVTGDPQTLASLYGKSPTLQRGATSGVEASDGALVASGWQAVTDDYLLGSALSGVTMAGDWTALLALKQSGTTGYIWSMAIASVDDLQALFLGDGLMSIATRSGGAVTTFSASALVVPKTSYLVVSLQNVAGTLRLIRPDTLAEISLVSQQPTGAPFSISIGCLASGQTIVDSATVALTSLHNVALSTAQIQRAYRGMKARAAAKGVVIL